MNQLTFANNLQLNNTTACPEGVSFCRGEAADRAGEDWHDHRSAEYALAGSYLPAHLSSVAGFCLEQLDGGPLYMAFSADGHWTDLNLSQVDELLCDFTVHIDRLRALRDQFAEATSQPCLHSVDHRATSSPEPAV
ncbi:hypothetical protein IW294_10035 [Streptomyces olivaceus]|uniref:hypothetical protein n=1 Tax=Streptomyces olivaceus TaxID=47716 RepID=UPI0018A84D61|nr:hypothetical protein [Streptomyces olivaceus]MBF8171111.1 hypothetical protein [Streptomyces olivaceus]